MLSRKNALSLLLLVSGLVVSSNGYAAGWGWINDKFNGGVDIFNGVFDFALHQITPHEENMHGKKDSWDAVWLFKKYPKATRYVRAIMSAGMYYMMWTSKPAEYLKEKADEQIKGFTGKKKRKITRGKREREAQKLAAQAVAPVVVEVAEPQAPEADEQPEAAAESNEPEDDDEELARACDDLED